MELTISGSSLESRILQATAAAPNAAAEAAGAELHSFVAIALKPYIHV